MTRFPAKAGLITALGVGIMVATATPASAVVVDPEPPEIIGVDQTCSDDVVPGTGSASITILNPVDSNGETRTYAWTLTGPGGADTGGVTLADGESDTVVINGLSAGDYDFDTFDAAMPALSASTTFSIPECPPPPPTTSTTTSTTTTTTPATTTTTTILGTTDPGTTVVVATAPPTPSPTVDPASPSLLPATGSNSIGFAVLAGTACFAGSLALLLSRKGPTGTTE